MSNCTVGECLKPRYARSMCQAHYARWYRNGDPLAGKALPGQSAYAFWALTEDREGCRVWAGGSNGNGYGRLSVNGRMVYAHRHAWQITNGDIPEGMVVDHTCYNRACVKPSHLRLATFQENAWNQDGARGSTETDLRNVRHMRDGWQVNITKHGKSHCFGTYESASEAASVAQSKRLELFGEYAGR